MNNQIEIWKDVPGYEGLYQCSNYGKVKSFQRKGRFLKAHINRKGYFKVSLFKNKKQKNYEVHQLVAICFLDHVPCGHKYVVDHIDNVRTNNNINNLQILSTRRNVTKSIKLVGASFHKHTKKWQASIHIDRKQIYIGVFETQYEAHLAYQNKLKELENE
jgi:hypothetical protein